MSHVPLPPPRMTITGAGTPEDGHWYDEQQVREYGDACAAAAQAKVEALKAKLAEQPAPALTADVKSIKIPTDTMEQEFQSHYRRGYSAGLAAAIPPGHVVVPAAEVEALRVALDIALNHLEPLRRLVAKEAIHKALAARPGGKT